MTTYAVTGATGQLGRFALDALLEKVAPSDVVAIARDPAKLAAYAERGVSVRQGDYDAPEGLPAALAGVDRLLLISGTALGERPRQHKNVITAAKDAGVSFIAYTSILDAPNTPIKLGAEHQATEASLSESGVDYALLRNGWYNENYIGSLAHQVAAGEITGAAGEGRISSASRKDLGEGAAAALINAKGGDVFELAGDDSWTMADFAAEVSRQSGKDVVYTNLSEEDYAKSLEAVGLPDFVAKIIANSGASTAHNALFNDSKTLSGLIGRPTTPISETIAAALQN